MFNVVLVEPEIPPNTGNIGRLCLATRSTLHLVRPLGFSIDDRTLKRAGLDYWPEVELRFWDSFGELQAGAGSGRALFFPDDEIQTGLTMRCDFSAGDFLVFGRETKGPAGNIARGESRTDLLTIPMHGTRSLNLATAVAIVLFEAVRQVTGNE